MKNRVAVTGMGVLAPNGLGISNFLSALKNGSSGIDRVSFCDTSKMRSHIAGEVKKIFPMNRLVGMSLEAAQEAMLHSGFELKDPQRCGVVWAVTGAPNQALEEFILMGAQDVHLTQNISPNAAARAVAEFWGCRGVVTTISNACAAGTAALGFAVDQIRCGSQEAILTGGCEPICYSTLAGFHALRSLDPVHCRPFDRERKGLVVGEGAACLILENLDHAIQRGARIHGEILGYGLSLDTYHETAPDPTGEGAARAIAGALRDSGIAAEDISYINAHGTGTIQNDRMETLAIKRVFGERAYQIPVSSIKSMIGHLMGAAGVVEAVASLLTIEHSFVPPTLNYSVPDPECDLDYVPNGAREARIDKVLSNNFGFGGTNATVVMGKFYGSFERTVKGCDRCN